MNEKPTVSVIFEVTIKPSKKQEYLDIAAYLKSQLDQFDGFISVERFQSLSDNSKLLSLSFWRDMDAVDVWRRDTTHSAAQKQGQKTIFETYRIRVAETVRDYGMHDRDQAPAREA